MKSPHLETGKRGENKAADYLRSKGYRVAETNYRTSAGEIDIIAWDKEILLFIEVKTRQSTAYGFPEEAVNIAKQNRIGASAEIFMRDRKLDVELRFDIISIVEQNGETTEILHIKDAFYPQGE